MNLLAFFNFGPKKCFQVLLHRVCVGVGTSAYAVYAISSHFCHLSVFGSFIDPVVGVRGVVLGVLGCKRTFFCSLYFCLGASLCLGTLYRGQNLSQRNPLVLGLTLSPPLLLRVCRRRAMCVGIRVGQSSAGRWLSPRLCIQPLPLTTSSSVFGHICAPSNSLQRERESVCVCVCVCVCMRVFARAPNAKCPTTVC